MYTYAYLLAIALLCLIWLSIFLTQKRLRREQLVLSLLTMPLAPISQVVWFGHDYWNPEYIYPIHINGVSVGFEELLFAFFIGGIGGVLFEAIFKRRRVYAGHHAKKTIWIAAGMFLLAFALKLVGFNTIWATAVPLLLAALTLVFFNPSLFRDFVWSSLLMTILAILIYQWWFLIYPDILDAFWAPTGLSGVSIFSVPVEELIWFFAWGGFSGIVYESWLNVKDYRTLRT
ncbi:MAG: lycopene cyclase domain-containing protein [Candidatus Paceibacterota bacterium]